MHHPNDDNDNYSLAYSQFVVPLVKAVQEQQTMIEEQKQKIDAQKQVNEKLAQRLEALEQAANKTNTSTGLNDLQNIPGSGFSMGQNEPNPFTHETVIPYTIPESVNNAFMTVYDLSGIQIANFPISQKGASTITITSEKLAAGMYIYSIIADGKIVDSKRMIVAEK